MKILERVSYAGIYDLFDEVDRVRNSNLEEIKTLREMIE
jgi:hypothetical protein